MDDRDLVRRVLAGEDAAFEEFFAAYFQRLFRFAVRRLGDAATAEDIVQATLIDAMRSLRTWRGEAALFTWLCSLCRHRLAAEWRRAGRQPVQSIDDDPELRQHFETIAALGDTPDTAFERSRIAELVQITLDNLPARYGDVLEWKYIEGLSVAEIAARLGSTLKAAESVLSRARESFREGFPLAPRS